MQNQEFAIVHLASQSILIILVIGLVSGWLAGLIVQGTGLGIVGDIVVGIIGAFIGTWLLPQLNIHLGVGVASEIINATAGAIVLLIAVKLVRGRSNWSRTYG
jgi:uncharacterized membrane protein YeaQ/YmgE (transglycosylase-associated protein family)